MLKEERKSSLKDYVVRHIELMSERYGDKKASVEFRKFVPYYFKGMVGVKELKTALYSAESTKELIDLLISNL